MANGAGIAYAGQDLTQSIRQMVIDRLNQKKTEQDMALAQQDMALKQQEAAQRAKIGDAQLASISDQRAAQTGLALENTAKGIVGPMAPGDVFDPAAAAAVRAGNQGSLIQHQTPTLPSTADTTPVTLPGNGQGASIVGTPRMVSNPGNPEQDVYRGSDKQRTDEQQKVLQGRLVQDPSLSPRERLMIQMENSGLKVPAGFEPKPASSGDANYMLDGKPIVAIKQNGRLTYQGQDVTDRVRPYVPPAQPTVVLTDQGLQSVDKRTNTATPVTQAGTGAAVTRSNPQIIRQQKAAELAQGDVSSALDQVDAAEKEGLLGPGAGRVYGQFLAGVIGSTGNAQADTRLGSLRAAIKDLNTSYPMAISGTARGGGGGTDRLNSVLNSDKFSADLMRGALHEISGALARRAKPDDKGGTKLSADELIKKYGG